MIHSLISLTLSNALGALALAVATVVVTRFVRTPALAHALWILVLVKLVSPAVVELPVRLPVDRPLLVLRAPEAHMPKVDPGVSSRLGETRPPGWAGLSETGDSEEWLRFSETRSESSLLRIVELPGSSTWLPPAMPLNYNTNNVVRDAGIPWERWFCITWGTGIAVWFAIVLVRVRQFRKWLKKTQPASEALGLNSNSSRANLHKKAAGAS